MSALRLLVTGGAGFIGANFVHYWLALHPGDRLVILDALTYSGNLANLAAVMARPEMRFVHGDIRDGALVESLLLEEKLDTIVHFAAESHVDRSIDDPEPFVDTNVRGTYCLLHAARRAWGAARSPGPCRFHHVSTDEVYGSLGPSDPPFTETTPYAPNSPYAATKAAADHLVRAYHRTYGLPVTISNCSNNYGRFHFPEKLIPLLIVNLLHGKPLPIYGDGMNVRDWLHVGDHCRGIDVVLRAGIPGETYNIGGRCEYSNLALVNELCAIADRSIKERRELRTRFPDCPASAGKPSASLVSFVSDRPGHDRRYATDCRKIEQQLAFRAQVSLQDGLLDTFRWYTKNESWWRPIVAGNHHLHAAATDCAQKPRDPVLNPLP